MVQVELWQPSSDEPVAVVTADDHAIEITGLNPDVVARDLPVLGLPSGQVIRTPEDNPKEWTRGLVTSYRSPDLLAFIVRDDNAIAAKDQDQIVIRPRVNT